MKMPPDYKVLKIFSQDPRSLLYNFYMNKYNNFELEDGNNRSRLIYFNLELYYHRFWFIVSSYHRFHTHFQTIARLCYNASVQNTRI